MIRTRVYFLVLIFSIAGVSLNACKSSSDSNSSVIQETPSIKPGPEGNANGTSDGGGGDVDRSTQKQVKEAIEKAHLIISNRDFWAVLIDDFIYDPKNFSPSQEFLQLNRYQFDDREYNKKIEADPAEIEWAGLPPSLNFYFEGIRSRLYSIFRPSHNSFKVNLIQTEVSRLYAVIKAIEEGVEVEYDPRRSTDLKDVSKLKLKIIELESELSIAEQEAWELPKSVTDFVSTIKIKFLEEGSCPSNTTNHADASVTDYTFQAELCFSLDQLQRIEPNNLLAVVTGLWVHELTHMAGEKNEDWAKIVQISTQLAVQKYINDDGINESKESLRENLETSLISMELAIKNLKLILDNKGSLADTTPILKVFTQIHNSDTALDSFYYQFFELAKNEHYFFEEIENLVESWVMIERNKLIHRDDQLIIEISESTQELFSPLVSVGAGGLIKEKVLPKMEEIFSKIQELSKLFNQRWPEEPQYLDF